MSNHPEGFWQLGPAVQASVWDDALSSIAGEWPDWAAVVRRGGWHALAEHVLWERQLGARVHSSSRQQRLYYAVKPVLPRGLTAALRRRYRSRQERTARLRWPIEDRYVRFLHALRDAVFEQHADAHAAPFWPDAARFAFVLTHDVETAKGRDVALELAAVDAAYGFRASFNLVPESYGVSDALLADLSAAGCEIGVHGLRHDGKLFSSAREFGRRALQINEHARRWGAVGFRAPLMHRDPVLLQQLEVEYDASFFDTDPYEPMPGGCMMVWPFFLGGLVELPYTLVQDHTLLVTLGERTPRLWLEKVAWIRQWGGMALLNAHPDYLAAPTAMRIYREFLAHMAAMRDEMWHVLPRAAARWWRLRCSGHIAAGVGERAIEVATQVAAAMISGRVRSEAKHAD